MSATIDLLICQEGDPVNDGAHTAQALYELRWLLADFSDTAGAFGGEDPGRALFIETIFGRSAANAALETKRSVVLAERSYPRQRGGIGTPVLHNFSARVPSRNRYLVERVPLLENIWALCEKRSVATPNGLVLAEFIRILRATPEDSGLWHAESRTKPMTMFLEGLVPESLVIPIIGSGITRDCGKGFGIAYLRPAIISF